MLPDWPTLFAPHPLIKRGMHLSLDGTSLWFSSAAAADLADFPAERFLTSAELVRASAFKFRQPRENFALGRLAGKLAQMAAVSANGHFTPNLPPDEGGGETFARRLQAFEIGNGEQGEPVVRAGDSQSPSLAVSLSHVNGLGVGVAFPAGQLVGLDLELIDPKRAETVRKGVPLSAEEEAWLKVTSLPEATALLLLWTARESLGKALGCGLACKWETLALQRIETVSDGIFSGHFQHRPQFRSVSWIGPGAVMSLAFAAA